MLKKLVIPVVFVVRGYEVWVSPEFKTVAAGVAIFMIGMLALEIGLKSFSGGVLTNPWT